MKGDVKWYTARNPCTQTKQNQAIELEAIHLRYAYTKLLYQSSNKGKQTIRDTWCRIGAKFSRLRYFGHQSASSSLVGEGHEAE